MRGAGLTRFLFKVEKMPFWALTCLFVAFIALVEFEGAFTFGAGCCITIHTMRGAGPTFSINEVKAFSTFLATQAFAHVKACLTRLALVQMVAL